MWFVNYGKNSKAGTFRFFENSNTYNTNNFDNNENDELIIRFHDLKAFSMSFVLTRYSYKSKYMKDDKHSHAFSHIGVTS